MQVTRPSYNDVRRALRRGEAPLDAAECHGVLCGMLCAAGSLAPAQWLDEILSERDAANVLQGEVETQLRALYSTTVEDLYSDAIEFRPLLPDDEVPLYERVLEMANFCQGFLYGFGTGGRVDEKRLPAQTRELLGDFAQLAQAASGDGEPGELEQAYSELVEFIRVGVLLIGEEMQPLHADARVH